MPSFEIRPMIAADIAAAAAMYKAGGWGERRGFLEWVLANPATRPLVGVRNGSVVATGMATINGPVGWVGSIFVDRTMRSQGYGRAITDAACALIDEAGCATQALIASEHGKALYVSMGFRVDVEYQVLEATTLARAPSRPAGKPLRPIRLRDFDRVCRLDRRATAEDRSELLRGLEGRAWVLEEGGELLGFVGSLLPDSGAVVASDVADAAVLLEHLRHMSHGKVRTVQANVPASNPTGIEALERLGWSPTFQTPRMLRGADVPWNPAMIWSILSRAWG